MTFPYLFKEDETSRGSLMESHLTKSGIVPGHGRKKHAGQVADALLTLICDLAKQEGGAHAEEFCRRIRGYQLAMYESGTLDETAAQECIDECAAQFGRLQSLTGEFSQFIGLLKESLTQRSEDSNAFHNRIFERSDDFKRLANLEDIREVRDHLVKLVRDLRQTVIDQQQQEEKRNAEFSKRMQELEAKLEVAKREAQTDPLTGIPNRAAFDRMMKTWIENKKTFVVGMIDLDHFKSINDTHGHKVGDSALICAAQWIKGNVRQDSFFARLGGDEFAVLLDNINLGEAVKRFSDLLAEFSSRSYVCSNGTEERTVKFTMSCGLAEFTQGDTADSVIQRADEGLRDAKKHRNKACTRRKPLFSGIFQR